MGRGWGLFAAAWVLILVGGYLGHAVQTAGGVAVEDVRFRDEQGLEMGALLYRPPTATIDRPAPAVLASHGYINTREMQGAFAIELARRGFVVLAIDMTGHGHSQGAVTANGFGGPAALRYLQGLPFVDRANIGLEGHSMGAGPVMSAATSQPDGYRSMVLVGSTPFLFSRMAGIEPVEPRNIALVFGRYDEFAPLMWGVEKGAEVGASPAMRELFGVAEPVQAGRIYGAPTDGTARVLHLPPITHPAEHFNKAAVAATVDWFQRTLDGAAAPAPPDQQIWIWKEVGGLVALVGFVMLLLASFRLLLAAPVFASLDRPAEPARERRDRRWWTAFVVAAALPALTFYPAMKVGQLFMPSRLFPQWITNQLLVWALATGLLILLAGLVLRGPRPRFRTQWLKSLGIALATVAIGYLSLVVVEALFAVDYRFWVLGLRPLDLQRAAYAAIYAPLWAAFFLVAFRGLHAQLAVRGQGAGAHMLTMALAMCLGFVALLALQYGWLFASGRLLTPAEPLNTIIAIQFAPLLAIVGLIGAEAYRRTNSYAPGAFICALFVTWYIVAGTAIHWSPDLRFPP